MDKNIKYFLERQNDILVLKYKYLLNLYYGKAKFFKYIRIVSTFIIPLILVSLAGWNTTIQLLILCGGVILYVYSYYQLSFYKEKAAYIHMLLDSFILELDDNDDFEIKLQVEQKILGLELEELVEVEKIHYTEKDMKVNHKQKEFEKNMIKLNIQRSNLIASYATREKYINLNITLLVVFCGCIILLFIAKNPKAMSCITGLIPIMLTIFNELAVTINENKKINNMLNKMGNVNSCISSKDLIRNQEFINLLRSEFVEIPTFIYSIYNSENLSVISICMKIMISIIEDILKILKKKLRSLKLILKYLFEKFMTEKSIIYTEEIFTKNIVQKQELYKWYVDFILKEIQWEKIEKEIEEEKGEIIKVGSAFNKVIVDYDIDIHIYVQEEQKIKKIESIIKNHFKKFEVIEFEQTHNGCLDLTIYLEQDWKLDIRISNEKNKIDYERKGEACLKKLSEKKIKHIIYLKKLKQVGILPNVPSLYIYYLLGEKDLSDKQIIKLIERFCLINTDSEIDDYSKFKQYIEEELKWMN